MISTTQPISYTQTHDPLPPISPLKKWLGNAIIRPAFFPLCGPTSNSLKEKLDKKKETVKNFWENTIEDTKFPLAPTIRELFMYKKERLQMEVLGEHLEVTIGVIEPKNSSFEHHYQLALGLPNLSTIDTNIEGIYPFLEAYLKKNNTDTLPPSRFFIISAYDTTIVPQNTPYSPNSMDESGLIFSKTLQMLVEKYGEINLLAVHSVSTFRWAAAIKYGPPNIKYMFADRGSASFKETSYLYLPGKIGLLDLIGRTGWDIDVGEQLHTHLISQKKESHLIFSAAQLDHRFPGSANLGNHPRIREAAGFPIIAPKVRINPIKIASFALGLFGLFNRMPSLAFTASCILFRAKVPSKETLETIKTDQFAKVTLLFFDFPKEIKPHKHHEMSLNNFHSKHVLEGYRQEEFLSDEETLPEALLRVSLPTLNK